MKKFFSLLTAAVAMAGLSYSPSALAAELELPYEETFDTKASLDNFTMIDANEDGQQWDWWYPGYAGMQYSFYKVPQDDWLITKSMHLETGKTYRFVIDVMTDSSSSKERFEVKLGTDTLPEKMIQTIIEPIEFNSNKQIVSYSNDNITVAESGDYYIGIHCISDADKWIFKVDRIRMEAGVAGSNPGALTDFAVVPNPSGDHDVTISFKAPLKDIQGGDLASLEKIVINRNGEVLHTLTEVVPGGEYSYNDPTPELGEYIYSAAAYNADGVGVTSEEKVFVGVREPAGMSDIRLTETETPGKITISWTPVATDKNGNAINPDKVSYRITTYAVDGTETVHGENITGSSYTFVAVAPGEKQRFVQYYVEPSTESGKAGRTLSPAIAAGEAFTIPFAENFANGAVSTAMWSQTVDGSATWGIRRDSQFEDLESQDGDGFFLVMSAVEEPNSADAITGKIDLSGCNGTPELSFWTCVYVEEGYYDTNTLTVSATEAGKDDYKVMFDKVIGDLSDEDGWHNVLVPLTGFEGKTVQLKFNVTMHEYAYTPIDNIRIEAEASRVISAVEEGSDVSIQALPGMIAVSNPSGVMVNVYSIDGALVAGSEAATASFSLPRGIYIVKTGNNSIKIAVK